MFIKTKNLITNSLLSSIAIYYQKAGLITLHANANYCMSKQANQQVLLSKYTVQ